jgi:hypothetical protein
MPVTASRWEIPSARVTSRYSAVTLSRPLYGGNVIFSPLVVGLVECSKVVCVLPSSSVQIMKYLSLSSGLPGPMR